MKKKMYLLPCVFMFFLMSCNAWAGIENLKKHQSLNNIQLAGATISQAETKDVNIPDNLHEMVEFIHAASGKTKEQTIRFFEYMSEFLKRPYHTTSYTSVNDRIGFFFISVYDKHKSVTSEVKSLNQQSIKYLQYMYETVKSFFTHPWLHAGIHSIQFPFSSRDTDSGSAPGDKSEQSYEQTDAPFYDIKEMILNSDYAKISSLIETTENKDEQINEVGAENITEETDGRYAITTFFVDTFMLITNQRRAEIERLVNKMTHEELVRTEYYLNNWQENIVSPVIEEPDFGVPCCYKPLWRAAKDKCLKKLKSNRRAKKSKKVNSIAKAITEATKIPVAVGANLDNEIKATPVDHELSKRLTLIKNLELFFEEAEKKLSLERRADMIIPAYPESYDESTKFIKETQDKINPSLQTGIDQFKQKNDAKFKELHAQMSMNRAIDIIQKSYSGVFKQSLENDTNSTEDVDGYNYAQTGNTVMLIIYLEIIAQKQKLANVFFE